MSSYIDREAVDDMIYDYSRSCDVNYGQLSERLYAIPSADVRENIHGEWIKADLKAYTEYLWECNRCKAHHRAMYDFCPSCGADMRGE